MLKTTALLVAAGLLGGTAVAHAGSLGRPCTTAPKSQWLSVKDLQAKVEAQGYKVRSAELEKACGEIYATDKKGGRVELFLDPTDGRIVGKL